MTKIQILNNKIKVKSFLKVLYLDSIDRIDIFDSKKIKCIFTIDFKNTESYKRSIPLINPLIGNKIITEIKYKSLTDSVMPYSTSIINIWCK